MMVAARERNILMLKAERKIQSAALRPSQVSVPKHLSPSHQRPPAPHWSAQLCGLLHFRSAAASLRACRWATPIRSSTTLFWNGCRSPVSAQSRTPRSTGNSRGRRHTDRRCYCPGRCPHRRRPDARASNLSDRRLQGHWRSGRHPWRAERQRRRSR